MPDGDGSNTGFEDVRQGTGPGNPPPPPTGAAADLGTSQPTLPPSPRTAVVPGSAPLPEVQHLAPGEERMAQLKADSFGAKTYHGILNALGGSQDISYSIDPKTGTMVQHTAASGPGTQWKRIISGALTGYAAGAGMTGPGSTAGKFGRGIQAGTQQAQQQDQQKRQQATEDFEREQKVATANLQRSLLSQQVTEATFKNQRNEIEASEADMKYAQDYRDIIAAGGPGTRDMGHFNSPEAVRQAFANDPTLHDAHVQGKLVTIPHITNGKIDGVDAAFVSSDWLHQKYDKDLKLTMTRYDDKGKPYQETFTSPANSLTNEQAINMTMAQSKDEQEKHNKEWEQSNEGKKTAAEELKARSEAAKNYAEARQLNQAADMGTIQSNAQQLVEGTMDIANLSKKAKTYDATLTAANTYSMQHYGIPFNTAKAAGDYKQANDIGTRNTLNYLNSLVGHDNQGGNLATLVKMSDGLDRSDFPALNDVQGWLDIQEGHPEYLALRTAALEVADQAAKILQGGGGGGSGTSDMKLKQAQEMFDAKFSADQIRGVAQTLIPLLVNRKNEMIGTNRYLQQWYGQGGTLQQQRQDAAAGAGGGGGAAGAQPQPGAGKTISLAVARLLPKYQGKSDQDITADAQGLGYKVEQ
jgi:hypothetical protein